MWIQFFKPILQDKSNKWWWSTDDFTCILFDHNRSILTFTHTLWIPNLHFSEIQVQQSVAGNSNLAHSRCPTLPLFVAELQDPLNILLGHWVIIFQRLKGNRRHAVFFFFFFFPRKDTVVHITWQTARMIFISKHSWHKGGRGSNLWWVCFPWIVHRMPPGFFKVANPF